MRIGIDVGGTHTDAVLIDGNKVITWTKATTSSDITTGIEQALAAVLQDKAVDASSVEAVMLGTTQFTNAVVERRGLSSVGAIRLAMPSGADLPPTIGWPEDIAKIVDENIFMISGGYLYDGKPLSKVNTFEVDQVIAKLKRSGVTALAITSAFSPTEPGPELEIVEQIESALPGVRISQSHKIGKLGLLERENATILNASLLSFAETFVRAFKSALEQFNLRCPFYISQNDGTLMASKFVTDYPVLTFSSGPTNSIRGAVQLSGQTEAIVVDIGGTTSDIGLVRDGFPQECNDSIEVGGVRTNFRMPNIFAIGVGGGSLVSDDGRTIGPESVGGRLISEALVFGGNTLTVTDVMVAAGRVEIGDRSLVSHLSRHLVENVINTIDRRLNEGIEKVKPGSSQLPVIVVGGGAFIAPERFKSSEQVIRPAHSSIANAGGAAMAQIGGEAERIVSYSNVERKQARQQVISIAMMNTVRAGAEEETLRLVESEETPVAYTDGQNFQLKAKVVGEISGLKQSAMRSVS